MKTKKAMTYKQLWDRLADLGYLRKKIELDGISQLVFKHPKHETAIILLPDELKTDPVQPIHLAAVRTILESHGVIARNGEPAVF